MARKAGGVPSERDGADSSPELQKYFLAVGARVRTLRQAAKMTQKDLGDRADFHYTYVAQVERTGVNLSMKTLFRIAEALDCSIHDLLPSRPRSIDYENRYRELRDKLVDMVDDLKQQTELDQHAVSQPHDPPAEEHP